MSQGGRPWPPADWGSGERRGHAAGHLGEQLPLQSLGAGHDGFDVLLLLLHAHLHVPHRHLVGELWHPSEGVMPCLAVEGVGEGLLRRFGGRRRRGRRRFRRSGRCSGLWVGEAAKSGGDSCRAAAAGTAEHCQRRRGTQRFNSGQRSRVRIIGLRCRKIKNVSTCWSFWNG